MPKNAAGTRLKGNESITARIVEAIKENIFPWQRPWRLRGVVHRNLVSKAGYRGLNQLLVDLTAMAEGYTSPWWLTYKQAAELSGPVLDENGEQEFHIHPINKTKVMHWKGGVKKAEKGTTVTFWKMLDKDKNNPDAGKYRLLRYYTVFNVEQCTGIDHKIPAPESHDQIEFHPVEAAESIVRNYEDSPVIKHGGDEASYNVGTDLVKMPEPEQFVNEHEYYKTLFHELTHSTRHPKRLNRDGDKLFRTFGDETYSKEELVAEICANFLANEAGLELEFDNSVAYIQGWAKALSDDPNMIVQAAGKAQKAFDYILGIKWDNDTPKEEENAVQ